jgi:hypothetical protein
MSPPFFQDRTECTESDGEETPPAAADPFAAEGQRSYEVECAYLGLHRAKTADVTEDPNEEQTND